jgi:chromosome segregation ATPase
MSPQKSSPATPPAVPEPDAALREELAGKIRLIQEIRKELIHAQITVLDLNDTILRKDTEKTDALALLGKTSQVLEEKLAYILELDRVLNLKITELQRALGAETTEKHARDRIIEDLVAKLDAANREIGATHTLAGNYARELAQTREQRQQDQNAFAESSRAQAELLAQRQAALEKTETDLRQTQQALATTTAALRAAEEQAAAMRATLSWRLTSPFRKLRRLFS